MSTLASFLLSLGAKPRANGEYEFDTCHMCSGKQCAYFNINRMVGICHKCTQVITLRSLADNVAGVSVSDLKQYVEDYAADERLKVGFQEAMLEGLLGESRPRTVPKLYEVQLPESFRLLEEGRNSVIGKRAIQYMVGRGFNIDVLFEMKFGYCADGEYGGRIIIPFYENGALVYWQARDFTGMVDPRDKIKNPRANTTIHGKSDVLFNHDTVMHMECVIMTESWGSALATGSHAFAINGKSMSEVQFQKIVRMPASTVIILLDADTHKQSWNAAAKLHTAQKNVLVCELKQGDPADALHSVLLDTVRSAKQYTAEEHIRSVAKGKWNTHSNSN